jgi:hypothetical protein
LARRAVGSSAILLRLCAFCDEVAVVLGRGVLEPSMRSEQRGDECDSERVYGTIHGEMPCDRGFCWPVSGCNADRPSCALGAQ